MSDLISSIPKSWTPELNGQYRVDELSEILSECVCPSEITVDTWEYTTFFQDIWNFLAWHIGEGALSPQKYSSGTALRVHFYCPTDAKLHYQRTIPVSRTISLKDCVLTITEVKQAQRKVRRTWSRWTLTGLFKDDRTSSTVDSAVSAVITLIGIPEGVVVSVASGGLVAVGSLTPIFKESKRLFVARHSADGGELWVDEGPPSAAVILGPIRLPDDVCEALSPYIGEAVTVPLDSAG
jgi:hypothetical protein